MTKREIMHAALRWERPAHVPWNFGFTYEAREKLVAHYGTTDLDPIFGNHILGLGSDPMACWNCCLCPNSGIASYYLRLLSACTT